MGLAPRLRRVSLLALAGTMLGATAALAWPTATRVVEASRAETAPAPDAIARVAPPSTEMVTYTGRCVDASSSAPIAGCVVRVWRWGRIPTLDALDTPAERESVRTASDGRFHLVLNPWDDPAPAVHCLAAGYGGTDQVPVLARGRSQDLGDIALRRGASVAGRALDTSGAPFARVELEFTPQARRSFPHPASTRCTTATDGTFVLGEALPPGTWRIDVSAAHALRSPLTFEVADALTPVDLTVVLFVDGEVPENEGVVVDDHDQPIPYARVRDGVVADAMGRFRHPCAPTNRAVLPGRVRYEPQAPGFEAPRFTTIEFEADGRDVPPGTRGITLRLRRLPTAAVEVVLADPRSGRPLEEFDVVAAARVRVDRSSGWLPRAWSLGPHAGGRARVQGVRPSEHTLIVRPGGELSHLVQAVPLPPPGDEPLVLGLPAPAELRLLVVSTNGEPVHDAFVELLLPLDATPLSIGSQVLEGPRAWPSYPHGVDALLVSTARTDREGGVVVRGPADRALAVRVVGRGHLPEVWAGIRLSGPPLRITLDRGATVLAQVPASLLLGLGDLAEAGRAAHVRCQHPLQPWARALGYAHLHDQPACGLELATTWRDADGQPHRGGGRPQWLPEDDYLFPVGVDGALRVDRVSPGSFDVTLRVPGSPPLGTSILLGSVWDVRGGETHRLDLDAEKLTPGELRGTVYADGRPWSHRVIRLGTREPWTRRAEARIECETDARGRFSARLLPGRWRLSVLAQGILGMDGVGLPDEVEVRPNATTEAAFAFARRRLTVRVVDAEGQPRRFTELGLVGDGTHVRGRTDWEGRFVLDPVLSEELRILTYTHGSDQGREWEQVHSAGSLRIPPTPRDPDVTFCPQ